MSKIGKTVIEIPLGVTASFKNATVLVKGKYGELSQKLTEGISIEIKEKLLIVYRPSDSKKHMSLHGLYRSLINNMIKGVNEEFTVKLELIGVGYRAFSKGQNLEMFLGFSHSILIELAQEVTVNVLSEKGKNPIIILKSSDKQLLGIVASKIRSLRKSEPYKGKGIKFLGEIIRRKPGKSVK